MINYFNILKVSEDAEIEVIHAAYKGLAKKYHPDMTTLPKDFAEKKMAEINEAYSILSDDMLRERHLKELQELEQNKEKYVKSYAREEYAEVYESSTDDYGIGFYIMMCVIGISVICCLIYFMPSILGNTVRNIQESIQEILSTF